MAVAFGIARHSGTLAAAAPLLINATTPSELARVVASLDYARDSLEEEMATLKEHSGRDTRFERIQEQSDALILSIEAIQIRMSELFLVTSKRKKARTALDELRVSIENIPVTGYGPLNIQPAQSGEQLSQTELERYLLIAEVEIEARTAIQLLESVFAVSHSSLVEPTRERFESTRKRIEENISSLEGSDTPSEPFPIVEHLLELGVGENNVFDLVEQELLLIEHQQDLMVRNSDIAVDMIIEVDGLVSVARDGAQNAALASSQAIFTGRTLLLAISAVSIGGALLMAWLFVGQFLLRRLKTLSDRMRQMAEGDLETKVEIGGRDEVAEMGAALEVFRQNSLEAQRLNLVEQLAGELQEKNGQLEKVLDELNHAQDQIVMREKLAALGELTAGVAHEIRNPLNFVKNFSEVSEELIEEMQETLDEVSDNFDDEHKELIDEISNDLAGNLQRIRTHSERANRIVHDMLSMGRGSGDHQPTDINRLLDEYARLAYHSARASDPDFQLDLRNDLDPNVGEIEIIPQDIGRVFLNLVSNSCQATDERRHQIGDTEKYGSDGSYIPTLQLVTKRGEEEIEIRIRDNGPGIPPEIIDSIFNPFFTTKPAGHGTGLGLAMSNDIIRKHGGSIRVESEPGEFTEMIIELPLVPPLVTLEEAETEAVMS